MRLSKITKRDHPQSTGRDLIYLCIGLVLVQAILTSITLPANAIFHDDWMAWQVDNPYHWYQIKIASELFKDRLLLGYDPRFAAGYLGGLPFNPSAKLPAFLTIVLSNWLSQQKCYMLYLAGTALISALCVPLAAYWMRCSRFVMVVSSIFGLCFWWASAIRWYYTVGMVGFVFATYLAFPFFARLRLLLDDGVAVKEAAVLGAGGAIGFFVHPLFPVLVASLLLPDAAINWRKYLTWPALGNATIVAGISLAANLFWVVPTLTLPGLNNGTDPYQKAVSAAKMLGEAIGFWRGVSMGAKINPLVLILSCIALWKSREEGEEAASTKLRAALLLSWGLLVVFGCFGAAVPVFGRIYPNRFSPIAYLFLVIPAATGARILSGTVWRGIGLDQRDDKRLSVYMLAGVIGCTGLAVLVANEVRRELSWKPIGHYGKVPPELAPIGPISTWILNYLRQDTDNSGRVLFEDSSGPVYDGGHMAGYYAMTSSRQFIGGPYPHVFFANFWDGWVFGKPIDQHSSVQFRQYLDLYNVHWIIAHSEMAKRYLRSMQGIVLVESRFGIDIYRVSDPSTFFIKGSGKIETAATNRIVLSDLSPGEVVIKYHYVAGLQADPPVMIQPEYMDSDPQPFIGLKNGSVNRIRLSWSPPH